MNFIELAVVVGVLWWIAKSSQNGDGKTHLNPSRIQPGAAENLAQVTGFNYTDTIQSIQQFGNVDATIAPGTTIGKIVQVVQSQIPQDTRVVTVTPPAGSIGTVVKP